jgi:hypothetical protein
MNISTRKQFSLDVIGTISVSTGTLLIAGLLVAAMIAAPAALGSSVRGGHRVTAHQVVQVGSPCPCNTGLPRGISAAAHAVGASFVPARQAAIAGSDCPCNTGLPGGPSAAGRAEAATLVAAHQAAIAGSDCPCNTGLPAGPRRSASG